MRRAAEHERGCAGGGVVASSGARAERQRASEASAHGAARVADEQAPLNGIHAMRRVARASVRRAGMPLVALAMQCALISR